LLILFDKAGNKVIFKLDNKVCPKTKGCSPAEIEKIKQKWQELNPSLSWIKAYSLVE